MPESAVRVVAAAPGGPEGPSARYRLAPVAAAGHVELEILPAANLPTPAQVEALLERADGSATLVLQRILPTRPQLRALRAAFRRLVFDFDDALYAVPPAHGIAETVKAAARLALRGSPTASARARPLARVLRAADAVVAGNEILAAHARRHARSVAVIPTTVEPVERHATPGERVAVWLGLPDNLRYLDAVVPALRETGARLRVVSSEPWERPGVETEFVRWSPEAARDALATARVGLAPLPDSAWTRGKCALRAIQYAGHGLPVVASPVGMTDRVVLEGRTGYLASSDGDWRRALGALLDDAAHAAALGAAGLEHVRRHFSHDVAVPLWHRVLEVAED